MTERDSTVFRAAAKDVFDREVESLGFFQKIRMRSAWAIILALLPIFEEILMLILDRINQDYPENPQAVSQMVSFRSGRASHLAVSAFEKADREVPR